jgi:uncharacterized membrane protein
MSDEKSLKTLTTVIYALQAAGAILPLVIPWVVAVVLNYVRKDEVAGTWLESHFRWQIRTFWFGLLWVVIGGILTLVFVGFAVLFVAWIWMVYRIVKGWLNLAEGKPVPAAVPPAVPPASAGT